MANSITDAIVRRRRRIIIGPFVTKTSVGGQSSAGGGGGWCGRTVYVPLNVSLHLKLFKLIAIISAVGNGFQSSLINYQLMQNSIINGAAIDRVQVDNYRPSNAD